MPDTTPTTDRVRSAAQRALQSLDDLIADTTDPGIEALGARHELATALFNTTPAPARLVLGTTDQQPAPSCRCHSRVGLAPHQHENDCPCTTDQQTATAPTDRRDRYAVAIARVTFGKVTDDAVICAADAAMAVADAEQAELRAAVLREAADAVASNLQDTPEYGEYVARFLRRLADEAQQPETEDESCGRFVPDTPRAPGLCASCGDARGWHSREAVEEQPAADQPDTETEAAK